MDHLSTKRILITGGLGYIGSEIFKMVKQYSEECLSIDKLADVSGNVQSLNLKDAAKTSKLIIDFKPDVIIHCATHSALAYRDHLSNSFQEDFSATVNMLNALAGLPDCRLIYFSSSYVYSGLPADRNYDESSLLAPQHNFGIAKSFFEQFILKIHPNTVIFRLCSVFGQGQALHP
ncbi:MAG: sugar nucleotide-binding protein, partial [Candidatus Staskawiczbacteria bacterium]|nr:sugar nucleotide-binding protein [Candidatus Staskawiczbacteria bacterium]